MTGTLWTDPAETGGRRRYLIADVFTSTPLEGNQLGVFLDGRDLTADLMQKAAAELHLSETVFFLPPAEPAADAQVRIFTPVSELPFAGHPVLGSAFVLADMLKKTTITLRTGAGLVPVRFTSDSFAQMEQRFGPPEPYERAAELLEVLKLTGSGLPVVAYQNGPRQVYCELPDEDAVASLKPDITRLADFPACISCFAGQGGSWKTRVFVPSLNVPEDPATGSAAGPLGAHLARHGRIPFGRRIEIRQGAEIGRPSRLYVTVEGSKDNIEHVYVGGSAVVVASGDYRLR